MTSKVNNVHLVEEVKDLTASAYIVRFQKNGMKFKAGQNLNLGLIGDNEKRDYSIYGHEQNEFLEVLIKEITDGLVSKKLRKLKVGDSLEVDGPFGFFTINEESRKKNKFLFIASGSGIAPFHCFALSYPEIDYKIIHGIRNSGEAYGKEDYPKERYLSCVTADSNGDFHGRVTDFLKQNPPDRDTLCYLCGNVNMIYDAFDILKEQGLPSENLFAEVYF